MLEQFVSDANRSFNYARKERQPHTQKVDSKTSKDQGILQELHFILSVFQTRRQRQVNFVDCVSGRNHFATT